MAAVGKYAGPLGKKEPPGAGLSFASHLATGDVARSDRLRPWVGIGVPREFFLWSMPVEGLSEPERRNRRRAGLRSDTPFRILKSFCFRPEICNHPSSLRASWLPKL